MKGEISEGLLAKIAKEKLYFKQHSETAYLLVYSLRLETNLDLLVLEYWAFALKVGSGKSSVALMFVDVSDKILNRIVLFNLAALVGAEGRVRVGRISEYCCDFASFKGVYWFAHIAFGVGMGTQSAL